LHFVLANTEFAMNGAALLLFRWAQHLAGAGHRITALHNQTTEGPLRDAYRALGIELVERISIDSSMLVVCNTLMAAPFVVQVASRARIIWWIHEGEIGLQLLAANPSWIPAFSRASAIIFPSAHIRDRVYRSFLFGVQERRTHIVPPGLDPFISDTPTIANPSGRVQIICVGSVYPRKRQADLIHAVAKLTDVDVHCLFVGKLTALEDDARQVARQRPQLFTFAGELPHDEALRLTAGADIFALPSASECLAIAPLEAGLRGKPVVLSDLPAHEGVWRHGQNALMHPVQDVDLLAHMLRILAIDPGLRQRLGKAARQTAASFRNDVFHARLGMVVASVV
jgi:glycosyltransferase involved in cell wall biosynthesis